jgi:preprotein translocase subunit SecG
MSSLFTFLLVVHAIIAAALVIVILMQRSEGGGFTGGGSPAGLMTARGAADFLTRATTILAFLFVALSIGLAALAASTRNSKELDTSLKSRSAPSESSVPLVTAPVAAGDNSAAAVVPAPVQAVPVQTPAQNSPVPLAVEKPKPVTLSKPVVRLAPPEAKIGAKSEAKPAPAPAPEAAKVTPPPVVITPPAPATGDAPK